MSLLSAYYTTLFFPFFLFAASEGLFERRLGRQEINKGTVGKKTDIRQGIEEKERFKRINIIWWGPGFIIFLLKENSY